MFTIYFAPETTTSFGFAVQANRDVICQVFKDISRLLNDVNPSNTGRVRIWVASNQSYSSMGTWPTPAAGSVLALASAFKVIPNGLNNVLIDNEVGKTIKGGQNSYLNTPSLIYPPNSDGFYHGYMAFNFTNFNWYNNFTNTSIGTTQFDLYSTALHEAVHLLGISSLISQNGSSKLSSNIYSLIDQHYTIGNTTNKLITFNGTTKQWNYVGGIGNLETGCGNTNSIFFNGVNLTGEAMYSNAPWSGGSNLSHLSCNNASGCSGYALNITPPNDYTMTVCSDVGVHFIKRRPNDNEVKALCDLGYELKNISSVYAYGDNSSNTTIYKTYSNCGTNNCYAIGYNDNGYTTNYNTAKTILVSDILLNDKVGSSGGFINQSDIKIMPEGAGSVTFTGSGSTLTLVFTPANNFAGEVTIGYYPKCSSTSINGSMAFIFIYVTPPPLPPCNDNGECNLACHGDFEDATNSLPYQNFSSYLVDLFHTNSSGTTCIRNTYGPFNTGTPLGGLWDCGTTWGGNCFHNLPNVLSPSGNQFVQIGSLWGSKGGVLLKLRKTLTGGNSYQLKFLGRRAHTSCVKQAEIRLVGDNKPPCPRANGTTTLLNETPSTNGTTDACGFSSKYLGQTPITSGTWQTYTINFTLPSGQNITDIIVYILDIDQTATDGYWGNLSYLDKIELYQTGKPEVNITTTPNTSTPYKCNSTNSITYNICLPAGASTITVPTNLKVTLPSGFSIASGSSFNSSGDYTIAASTLTPTNNCVTLTLNYTMSSSVVTDIPYPIAIAATGGNTCLSSTSNNIVNITPKLNPLSITKSVSNSNPANGNTITYTIEIANISTSAVSNVLITDNLPAGLTVANLNGFTQSGNVLTRTVTIPAGSTSSPYYASYSFDVTVNNTCKIENCASLSFSGNTCTNQGCVTINSQNDYSISVSPQGQTICNGQSITLNSTLNPSTTSGVTYQWQKDGVNISGATSASYNGTQSGVYTVQGNKGGCIKSANTTVTEHQLVAVNSTITHPICSASNGSIVLTPTVSGKNYTYAWSGGSTSNTRNSLGAGTYTVTITDVATSCTVSNSYTLTVTNPTITLTPTLVHPVCTSPTGSISLSASGGTSPYNYAWSGGLTGNSRTGLVAGTYAVTTTDNNGCSVTNSYTLTVTPNNLTVTPTIIQPKCGLPNGSISLVTTGGTTPYTYSWAGGASGSSRTALNSGTYAVTSTDSKGCSVSNIYTLNSSTNTLSVSITTTNVNCNTNTGTLTANVSGGTSPYTYLWNTGNNTNVANPASIGTSYTVTVTDASGVLKHNQSPLH